MLLILILLLLLPTCLNSLICTSCPFNLEPPHSYSCADTCQGDICYIVVNKYFNGTVIAGCLTAGEKDSVHNGTSVCHRKEAHTICACTSSDKCNDPRASLATYDFTENEILEGHQIFPQIQPTEPPKITENMVPVAEAETIEEEKKPLVDVDKPAEPGQQNETMGVEDSPTLTNSTIDQLLLLNADYNIKYSYCCVTAAFLFCLLSVNL